MFGSFLLAITTRAGEVFLPSFIIVLTAAVLAVGVVWIVRALRRQHLLKYSITLVELKYSKIPGLIGCAMLSVVLIICFWQAINPGTQILGYTAELYISKSVTHLLMACLSLMTATVLLITLVLTFSKSAVVDRGIHTKTKFLDWYHIYDYHFDEKKHTVVLSSSRSGALTISGLTPPLKYDPNDFEKLKFILNKNKNKFIPRYELR